MPFDDASRGHDTRHFSRAARAHLFSHEHGGCVVRAVARTRPLGDAVQGAGDHGVCLVTSSNARLPVSGQPVSGQPVSHHH